MKTKNGKIRCLFCDGLIKCQSDLSRFISHMEQEHEVTLKIDLVVAVSFLRDNEILSLTEKLKPRIDTFIASGEVIESGHDIFHEEFSSDNLPITEMGGELQITSIQRILNDASEDESELVIIQANGKDNVELAEEDAYEGEINEISNEKPATTENLLKSTRNETRIDYPKPSNIKLEQTDDIDLEDSFITDDPNEEDNDLNEEDNDLNEEDNDLDYIQQEILQNVSCELEIGVNEIEGEASSVLSSNLLERFSSNDCRLCYSQFSCNSHLKRHEENVHKNDKDALELTYFSEHDLVHICNMCPLRFLTENILINHKRVKHRVEVKSTTVKCEVCTKIVKYNSFKTHMQSHTAERVHECQLCYVKFKSSNHLKRHQGKIHKTDLEKEYLLNGTGQFQYECDNCNLSFLTENLLANHTKQHVKDLFKNYNCQYCPKIFVEYDAYRKHVAGLHKKKLPIDQSEKKYGCKLCYTRFRFNGGLHDHIMKIHQDDLDKLEKPVRNEDLKFRCDKCDQRFLTGNILNYHSDFGHRNRSTEMECKLCYRKFKKTTHLQKHEKRMHTDEEEVYFLNRDLDPSDLKFNCRECEKKFVTKSLLDVHAIKHQSEKNKVRYECNLCYKVFKKLIILMNHQKRMHSNETEFLNRDIEASDLKFSCTECDKRFVTESILVEHYKKHQVNKFEYLRKEAFDQSESTYKCKLCYSKYKYFDKLLNHIQSIHREEDADLLSREIEVEELVYSCDQCEYKFVAQNFLDYHDLKNHTFDTESVHCKLCDINFKVNKGLWLHYIKVHKNELAALARDYSEEDMVFLCTSCDKKYVTEISLKYHIKKHHKVAKLKEKMEKKIIVKIEKREVYCKLCFINYKDPRKFRRHKQKVHAMELDAFEKDLAEEDMQHLCTTCNRRFYSQIALDYHMKRRHNKGRARDDLSCKLCYNTFKHIYGLKKHVKSVHEDELHYLNTDLDESLMQHHCRICDRRFVTEHSLAHHQKYQHKEAQEKVSYCKLCYVDFKFNANLKAHKSKVHSTRQEMEAFSVKMENSSLPFKCKFCKKRFLTKNILNYHNIYNHKEEKRQDLTCQFCNKIFQWKYSRKVTMQNHMRNLHNLDNFNVEDHETDPKKNVELESFMRILNSVKPAKL